VSIETPDARNSRPAESEQEQPHAGAGSPSLPDSQQDILRPDVLPPEDLLRLGHVKPFRRPPALRARQFLRRNLLLGVATLIFLSVLVLLLYQVDRVYYVNAKKDTIRALMNEQQFLADEADQELLRLAREYADLFLRDRPLSDAEERRRLTRVAALEAKANEVFASNPAVYRIQFSEIASGREILLIEDRTRLQRENTFRNNLFIRDFSDGRASYHAHGAQPVSVLSTTWTSPRGFEEIEQLTNRWRLRAAGIVGVIGGLYVLLLWGLLLPVRRVMIALDKGESLGAPLISNPSTLLERYYNNLGRDATLSLFSTGLRNFVASTRLVESAEVFAYVPRLSCALFPLPNVQVWIFHRDENNDRWTFETVHDPHGASAASGAFGAMLEGRFSESPRHDWCERLHHWAEDEGEPRPWYPVVLFEGDRALHVLVVWLPHVGGNTAWWSDLAASLTREIRYGLRNLTEQRKMIISEKSKANISLSRNIGHDLTNIIATGKLELMTVKALLDMPQEKVYSSPEKQRIFRESLEALLNNTRFLQETVNLYRSFTYLSRPKFEEIDLNELATEVRGLFELTLSKNIKIKLALADSVPKIQIEPRLIRLALFNLLANAADSIKREVSAERTAGCIWITTSHVEPEGRVELSVEDDGGGIRDSAGRHLDPHEIDAIFQLGYSTKEEGSGEGLGLNWVQQIVREFHGGTITARNRPDGGARFTISLRQDRSGVSG